MAIASLVAARMGLAVLPIAALAVALTIGKVVAVTVRRIK